MPVVDGLRTYESLVVVPASSPARDGRAISSGSASPTPTSCPSPATPTSGGSSRTWARTRTASSAHGDYTHSHDRSIAAVATGLVDGAAVHGGIWARLVAADPSVARRLRVRPPLAAVRRDAASWPRPPSPPELRARLREVLLALAADPEGAAALRLVGIDRFEAATPDLYDAAARVVEAAAVTARLGGRPPLRLWVKLAALAALGVVAMHALHLVIAQRIAGAALAREQEAARRRVDRPPRRPAGRRPAPASNDLGDAARAGRERRRGRAGTRRLLLHRPGRRGDRVELPGRDAAGARGAPAERPTSAPLVVRSGAGSASSTSSSPSSEAELGLVRLGLDMGRCARGAAPPRDRARRPRRGGDRRGPGRRVRDRPQHRPARRARSCAAADRFDPSSPAAIPAVDPAGQAASSRVLGERFNRMMQPAPRRARGAGARPAEGRRDRAAVGARLARGRASPTR